MLPPTELTHLLVHQGYGHQQMARITWRPGWVSWPRYWVSKLIEAGVTNQAGRQGAKEQVVSEDNEGARNLESRRKMPQPQQP